jgi:hypothetical protein
MERSANVYEKKGPQFRNLERSGNVYEEKGTYPFNAVMLLKTNNFNATDRKDGMAVNDIMS